MLSGAKSLQSVADQLGHVGVKKIDEVYGRWKQRHKFGRQATQPRHVVPESQSAAAKRCT
jgi:hypothetical protein